jgi:hypothetical protein
VAELPVITRPNGKPYQPRKVTAYAVTDDDEITVGVIVFGTHDPARAQELADQIARWDIGGNYTAVDPVAVWWDDRFECGRRVWVTDEEHGRGGIWFREIVERSPVIDMGYLSLPAELQAAIETGTLCRDNGKQGDGDG